MYKHFNVSPILSEFIHSFWWAENTTEEGEKMIIVPDGFFKIILILKDKRVIRYFMTGLWTKPQEFIVPPKTESIGCRFKILAPEYLIKRSIRDLVDSEESLPLDYLDARFIDFINVEKSIRHLENSLLKVFPQVEVQNHKIRLSQFLYQAEGGMTVKEVGEQTFWATRQINRYFDKYLGINLKTYLKIQRSYSAYFKIREGDFSPTKNYYDQSHYIREIKEHTGVSPKEIYKNNGDIFRHIRKSQK
ncbi:MAG: DUF6597 domain-containing transcriptional factor [Reichenbachiella sp.]|uniref:helix-turn-helix transcriptional regulator n=1 Tax=Reichenbachiella sp. TaxID=2184521 RepID=UPI0032651354